MTVLMQIAYHGLYIIMDNSFYNVQNSVTQSNPNRFYRTSRASSLRRNSTSQYEPKETFKLAALHSVTMGIKYSLIVCRHNDTGFITGRDLNKLRAYDNKQEDLSFVESSHALKDVRKRFDDLKKQNVERERLLIRLKEQADNVKGEENKYIHKKQKAAELTKQLQAELIAKKNAYEEVLMERKSMSHVAHRLKEDKVVYDFRKFNAQKELEYVRKQLGFNKVDASSVYESKDRAKLVFERLAKQLQSEQRDRQNHLESLRLMIANIETLKEVAGHREEDIREIAERAMQDKDDTEKNWRNLMVVHKFLSRMLKDKMDREMSKFSVVELAFKNIKIATGTNDTQTLVSKFLNKEAVYGELLSTIAENQRKIEKLKHDKEELLKERKQIEDEMNLFEITKKADTDLSKELKSLDVAEDKEKKAYAHTRNLLSWVRKQLRKIDKVEGKSTRVSGQNAKEAVKQFLDWLENSISVVDKLESTSASTQLDKTDLSKKDFEKVMRVRPKKFKKNTEGQESPDEDDEEVDFIPEGNAVEEEDHINSLNNDLMRTNDKFMKELKKKRQAMVKIRMEMSPKKKEEKVPEKAVEKIADE